MKRDVYIRHEPSKHSFFVCFKDRKPRTKMCFAQFDDRHSSMQDVIEYVRKSDKVILVCAISGKAI